jgi:ubiquitin carboxyl-terminal hydrolase 14
LKDDQDLSKLGIKPNHQFMLMGTPSGNAIQMPKEKIKFLEDMTEAEVAQSDGAQPAGLQNLGNTCYLNSTLQTLRAIPELQTELLTYKAGPTPGSVDLSQFGLSGLGASGDLTASLRDLYSQMGSTQEGFPPLMFLNAFRAAYPQFAEQTRDGRGYAQQDAEEAWSQIISQLRQKLKSSPSSSSASASAETTNNAEQGFIDRYMGGKFQVTETCNDEAAVSAGEKPTTKPEDVFFKLDCHVAEREILHLNQGIGAALKSTYEKTSPTLNREASYSTILRISRLPKYLPVHFVRFFWKRDVNKKAKILRKVSFPFELDLTEYCTDELKGMLVPVRDKIRDLRKQEIDIERAKKRQKRIDASEENDTDRGFKAKARAGPASDSTLSADKKENAPATNGKDTEMKDADGEVYKTDAEIEAERAASLLAAKKDILSAVNSTLLADSGACQTGLYELRGLITHQGASADSGHYISYVKKMPRMKKDEKTGKLVAEKRSAAQMEGDVLNGWWKFDDEKVSECGEERIKQLAGGGESASALVCLYAAVPLPELTEEEEKA